MRRVSPVLGSCRMTLRVLFAGAFTALPLFLSGAQAQTAAAPPAVTISPPPSADSAGPAAARTFPAPPASIPASSSAQVPANQPAAAASSAPSNPVTPSTSTQGLASPFMPQAATPPIAGTRFGAWRFPVVGCAHSRSGRGAETEESRSPSAAARDRAQRRSSPNPSARHLLRDRQGVGALFDDRGRGRLANRHRRNRPRNQGSSGR